MTVREAVPERAEADAVDGSVEGPAVLALLSLRRPPGAAPFAPLITSRGWALGLQSVFGRALVVTPEQACAPEELHVDAPVRPTSGAQPAADRAGFGARVAPGGVREVVSDVRRMLHARRFRRRVATLLDVAGDDVQLVWQRHALFDRSGLLAAHRLQVPLVLSMHAALVREARGWGVERRGSRRAVERLGEVPSVRGASVVACVSEAVAEAACSMGAAEDRVIVTPNGVDLHLFRHNEHGPQVRRHLGVPPGTILIGWAGSFRAFHGVDRLLDAVAQAAARTSRPVALVLIGEGTHRGAIAEQAASLHTVPVLIPGAVPHTAMPDYLSALDVAVVAHGAGDDFHYSPVKLREYLAVGLPVVAPRAGEIGRWLVDGNDALLYEPHHPDSLVDALLRLIDDPSTRAALSTKARERAERDASWEAQARAVKDHLAARRASR